MLRPDAGAQDNIGIGPVAPAGSVQEIVVKKPREIFGDPEFPGGELGPDRRFGGVLTSDLLIYGELENVTDLNVAWTREQYQWERMSQFDENQFDLTATDRNYRTGLEQVGLAFRTPNYANGGQRNQIPPSGLDLPWNDGNNHWGWFLHHLAKSRMPASTVENQDGTFARAAGDRNPVGHWVIWNEPDICVPTHPRFSWNVEPRAAQYLPLLRTGWHAVKNASSDLGVIFGSLGIVDSVCDVDKTGMSFWHDLLEAYKSDPAAADNQFYFDHMSVNLHKEPERVGEMIKKYRESLNAEGMTGKEVWLMEMGVPTSTEPIDPKENGGLVATPEEQKQFLMQAYSNALVAGAARIAVFEMRDYLRSSPGHVALRTTLKFLKNTNHLQGEGGPIVKAGVDGKEERLPLGVADLGFAGATALFDAPWGQKIYFIGGGTTMYRYPDTVRMLTPSIVG